MAVPTAIFPLKPLRSVTCLNCARKINRSPISRPTWPSTVSATAN
jgi:hypothetical protein